MWASPHGAYCRGYGIRFNGDPATRYTSQLAAAVHSRQVVRIALARLVLIRQRICIFYMVKMITGL